MIEADPYVEADPDQSEPSGPVLAKKHEDAGNNCQQVDKKNQDQIGIKWLQIPMVSQVGRSSGDSRHNQQVADASNRKWALLHRRQSYQRQSCDRTGGG